jgi:hypothetical protein
VLSGHRVNNPGQDQPGHRNEQGPEHSLHLHILPERFDRCIRVCLHCLVHELRQKYEQRKEEDRSTDERKRDLGPASKEDPDRDR